MFLSNLLNKTFLLNFLFATIVVSFILGNLALNINVLLIIFFAFCFYFKTFLNYKIDFFDKVLTLLFFYIVLCSTLNNLYFIKQNIVENFTIILKSLLFLRFLIFYYVIRILIKKRILNLKFFFIISSIGVLFVSVDIIFQFFFGYDVFGFTAEGRRLSGPFGDEMRAGSFIQRFSLFLLFLIPIFFKIKNRYIFYAIVLFLVCLITTALIFAGNRVPFTIFILTILSITIFQKNLRIFFIPFIITTSLIIFVAVSFSENIYYHLGSFQQKVKQVFLIVSPENLITKEEQENEFKNKMFYTFEYDGKKYKMTNTYLKEFKTGYLTWQNSKYFGSGIKSFKIACPLAKTKNCGIHPHNYYLEILSSLGLVGFMIILFLFLIVFDKTFIKKYFKNSSLNNNIIITPFIFLFFAEIFPIKSTGSFFTTNNATYIFLILSILIALSDAKNKIERKPFKI